MVQQSVEVGAATHVSQDAREGGAVKPANYLAGLTGGSMKAHDGEDFRSVVEGRKGADRMQAPLNPAEKSRLDQLCASPLARQEVLKQIREVSERAGLAGFEVVRTGAISDAK